MSDLTREDSWYVNCPDCRADYHIVGHNRFADRDEWPDYCSFCGSVRIEIEADGGQNNE